MDVMLSMRAQGIITSPTKTTFAEPHSAPRSPTMTVATIATNAPEQVISSSASARLSIRSSSTLPKAVASAAVAALKGVFSGLSRPGESEQRDRERERVEEQSFGSIGNSLMSMSTSEGHSQSIGVLPQLANGVPEPLDLERKIVAHPRQSTELEQRPAKKDRSHRTPSVGSVSLQPPPRKRWTASGIVLSAEPTPTVNVTPGHERAGTEPTPSLSNFSFGSPEQKPRAPSMSSVSTLADGDGERTSNERSSVGTKRSSSAKRWSRQLPQRLTPPSGPPPAIPSGQQHTRLQPHPYAASDNRPPSRNSSNSSRSVVSNLPSFSKRASGGSALSLVSTSTSHSANANVVAPQHSRPGSSHRVSVPPPPRPAPTFGLPPTPITPTTTSAVTKPPDHIPVSPARPPSPPPPKSSLRDRAFRLSLAPKPPPSTVLPPRPDEPSFTEPPRKRLSSSKRRESTFSSSSAISATTSLGSGSNLSMSSPSPSPFPPPQGPLPPTPPQAPPTSIPSSPSRHTSLKQRLRILSAPSATTPSQPVNAIDTGFRAHRVSINSVNGVHRTLPSPFTPLSPPLSSPIGKNAELSKNDSFLQLTSPMTATMPPPVRPLPPPPLDLYPELPLSPPPRRSSRQITLPEKEVEPEIPPSNDPIKTATIESPQPLVVEDGAKPFGDAKPLSLSHHGSVISLGIVSV